MRGFKVFMESLDAELSVAMDRLEDAGFSDVTPLIDYLEGVFERCVGELRTVQTEMNNFVDQHEYGNDEMLASAMSNAYYHTLGNLMRSITEDWIPLTRQSKEVCSFARFVPRLLNNVISTSVPRLAEIMRERQNYFQSNQAGAALFGRVADSLDRMAASVSAFVGRLSQYCS